MWLFVLFVMIPLIEIALFIQIGGWLTLWPTLAIVVATAALGAFLARLEGARTLAQIQRALDELKDPATPLAHGAMILFAGALLLTPGFLTDAVGFALLLPPVRTALLRLAIRRGIVGRAQHPSAAGAEAAPGSGPRGPGSGPQRAGRVDIIEGEFEEHDSPPRTGPPGGSGWTRH